MYYSHSTFQIQNPQKNINSKLHTTPKTFLYSTTTDFVILLHEVQSLTNFAML